MSRQVKTVAPLLSALVLMSLCLHSGSLAQSQSDPFAEARAQAETRIASFNRAVKAAKGGDPAAVSKLADEVFQRFGHPELTGALDILKDRVVRAEVSYRQTGKGEITEASVVQAINGLTRRFNAPPYAEVSVYQVRYLRTNLMGVFPGFIGQATAKQAAAVGLNPKLSPLEAVGIGLLLINQKLSNEDFQVSPQEWLANLQKRSRDKWQAYKSGKAPPAESRSASRVQVEGAKTKEMRQVVTNAINTLGPQSLIALAHSSLDVLGIPR